MSVMEAAREELERSGFGEDDSRVMLEILGKFFEQWDSGGAVYFAAIVLRRLLGGQPLTPLTGDEREWNEVGEQNGRKLYQNRRCSTVFREGAEGEEGGRAYDIDVAGRPSITFPYDPETRGPTSPTMVIEVPTGEEPKG